ncbi:retrovirus-related pol polyprotein from transposon TNT 1-94 [Tanacetum coccineum]
MLSFLTLLSHPGIPTTKQSANELREQTTYAAGTTRKYTPRASGSNTGKQRTVICYNCKGEGHIAKQCTKPKRKRDETWFNDKVLLVQAQASGQVLTEEEISFFSQTNPGLPDTQKTSTDYSLGWRIFPGMAQMPLTAKVRESKPKLYDGNVILKMDTIVIPDSDETLMLCEESRSKMLLKEQDPMVVKHKVNTKPINYAILNNDYNKRFVRQSNLYSEHAYWKATSVTPLDPSPSSTINKVEVPKELPKVSMVNTRLKELKRHLTGFDQVVKERTTATAITEGTWGFEHTKACFRDEIIPFIKELKDIFNNFNQYLVDELADVQNVSFYLQMNRLREQHRLESRTFKVKMNQVLSENERLLAQAIDHDIVKTVVNLSVNDGCETVNECQKCLELKTELLNKKDFVDKETYDKLCKSFTTLEKHCITLEADSQLNQEIFQQKNSVLDQNAPSFTQLFELSELRAQSQEKDTVIVKLKEQIKSLRGNVDDSKVKMDMDEIETLNIELEHRVTKLVAENEHLKQTYKQLYDSINQNVFNQRTIPKNELRKLKGKALDKEAIETHSVDPNVSKDNVEPITPKLLNKRTAHSSYIKHTQEEALVLRDIVEHVKANYPQDSLLESAFRNTKVIQELLQHKSRDLLLVAEPISQLQANTRKDKETTNTKSYDNLCVSNSMNDVKFLAKPKKRKSKKEIWNPTGKVFTKIGYIWRPTGKSSKKPTNPKSEDTNQEKLYLVAYGLCGPMRVAGVQMEKVPPRIDDDSSRFTWVKCILSKDEAPAFIINFLKISKNGLRKHPSIRTDNGTEFVIKIA